MLQKCNDCGKMLPLENFTSNRKWCRACVRKYDQKRYYANLEESRRRHNETSKAWHKTPKGKAKLARENKKHRERHPERYRARWMADRYIKLEGLCQDCGKVPATKRHHDDYSKPLEVDLLCHDCHAERHRKMPV